LGGDEVVPSVEKMAKSQRERIRSGGTRIQEFDQGVIIGKKPRVLANFLKRTHVHGFDSVSGVDHLTDFRSEIDGRILPIPLRLEFAEPAFSLFDGGGLIYLLEVSGDLFAAFPRNVLQAVAHHVHNAELNNGLRKDRFDGLRKSLQAIDTGDQNVLDAAVSEFGHDL
jgi:hypothetical protein